MDDFLNKTLSEADVYIRNLESKIKKLQTELKSNKSAYNSATNIMFSKMYLESDKEKTEQIKQKYKNSTIKKIIEGKIEY